MSDNFAKAIAIINDGVMKRMQKVTVPKSRLVVLFLVYLSKQGFIDSFFIVNDSTCLVFFRFVNNSCLLKKIIRISKPSQRIYLSYKDLKLKKKWQQLHHGVLSTSKGLICSDDAYLSMKTGGELLVDILI
jgi:small subunit ribosomal protein S8